MSTTSTSSPYPPLPFNSIHLSIPSQPSQFCSQCKILLPSTSFPLRLTNLSLMPVCNSHTWYYGGGNRILTLVPDLISTLVELEEGMKTLVGEKEGEGRWICEGLVEDFGVNRIMNGGNLDSEQLRPPRSRKKEGPTGTLYRLTPTLSREGGTQYNLNVFLHPLQSKTVFVIRELDSRGKEIKIEVEKPPKRVRGKAKKGIWLNPGDEGLEIESVSAVGIVAVPTIEESIGEIETGPVTKKLRTLPGKGKGVKRLVAVPTSSSSSSNLPSLPSLPLQSLRSSTSTPTFNPIASTSKQGYVDQLDMLASVLDAATKDTDIMLPRRKRPLSHLPPAFTTSSNNNAQRINPLPKRRIPLTHHPLAKPASTNNSIFHPVAIASSSPTRSPTRRSVALNNQNGNVFISPTRANNSSTLLSIHQNPSNDHLQPLSLADLLASPFLGSPPLPIRKQPLSFISQGSSSHPNLNGSLPIPSFTFKSPRKINQNFLPNSPSRLYKSTTPHTSPSKNTRSSTTYNNNNHNIPISPTPNSNPSSSGSGSGSNSNSNSGIELEDILLQSEGEFSEEEFSEEEDEGDWLTGFVKGQLGSRYLGPGEEDEDDYKSDEEKGDDDDEGSEGSDRDAEGESEEFSEDEEEEI